MTQTSCHVDVDNRNRLESGLSPNFWQKKRHEAPKIMKLTVFQRWEAINQIDLEII